MTPFQTYGQASAPSNMMFPTAAYMQAAQNAANMQMQGMEKLGAGLAKGIDTASALMQAHKEQQAQFDATKKLYKAFEGYLPDDAKQKVQDIFADTTMSVAEKNKLAPMLLNMLGQAQQQSGRERVADIMNQGRVDAAGVRRPTPMTGSTFGGVPTVNSILDLPVNPSQGNPTMLQGQPSVQPSTQSGQPASRIGANGQMEVWSSRLGRYVELDNQMQNIQD